MAGKLCTALKVVERGGKALVLATSEVWDELEAARASGEARNAGGKALSRNEAGIRRARTHMATCAHNGPTLVRSIGALVPEGKHSSGIPQLEEVLVLAFKHDQFRAYCTFLPCKPIPCIVLFQTASKKTDKADQQILASVAKQAAPLIIETKTHALVVSDQWPPQ